jgi:hypothetical protein
MPKVVEASSRAKRAAANMLDTPHLGIPYHAQIHRIHRSAEASKSESPEDFMS